MRSTSSRRPSPAAPEVFREGLETLARLLGPMMPHLAEEMWQTLGRRRPARRAALARRRSGIDPRRAGDDRRPGQRQTARHARHCAGHATSRAVESAALHCRRCCAGSKGSRRARSSSCRTASSTSSREPSGPLPPAAARLLLGLGWASLCARRWRCPAAAGRRSMPSRGRAGERGTARDPGRSDPRAHRPAAARSRCAIR